MQKGDIILIGKLGSIDETEISELHKKLIQLFDIKTD